MSAHVPSSEELRRAASRSGFRVKLFADLLGLEVRTLERRFDETFGCSPQEWLAHQRMRDGMALLERGWSTKEVAAALGFGDRSSLFREFRRRVGCTPCACVAGQDRAVSSPPKPVILSESAVALSQIATPHGLRFAAAPVNDSTEWKPSSNLRIARPTGKKHLLTPRFRPFPRQ